jgi:hypothetical protein
MSTIYGEGFVADRMRADATRARCFDKDWTYTPACSTNIRERFERVRAELEAAKAQPANVKQLRKAK